MSSFSILGAELHEKETFMTMRSLFPTTIFAVAVTLAACGDDTTQDTNPDMTACTGGPASGAADAHCAGKYVTVDAAECSVDAGHDHGGGGGSDYGDTMYGTSGYDDDCKYQVSYTVDPICENAGVTFTVTAKAAVGGAPVTGAKTRVEAFLDDTHPAPNSGATTSEGTGGTYKIGPVKLDKPGRWTVRFHFFESCEDSEASPHGHAAFFVDVP